MKTKTTWDKPHEVQDAMMAFPARIVGTLLPPMAEIPDDFTRHENKWCRLAMSLFFNGGTPPRAKEGIDPEAARRHLVAVLRSFEPKHEHKEAGAGWLMSMWYEYPEQEGN